MKQFIGTAAAIGMLCTGALAQDPTEFKMKQDIERVVAMAKMGKVVRGAPYSAEEVTESTQILADGTRIRNESRTKVYRDSEGRTRRESGDHATIWDPVANANYSLDLKNMTGVRTATPNVFSREPLVLHDMAATRAASGAAAGSGIALGGGGTVTAGNVRFSVKDGMVTMTRDGQTTTFPIPPDGQWTSEDGKIRAVFRQNGNNTSISASSTDGTSSAFVVKDGTISITKDGKTTTMPMPSERLQLATGGPEHFMIRRDATNTNNEELGEQMVEGVKSRGTRSTSVLAAGAIGNDRPLTTVSERWYSEELQMEVMSRRSDPRSGESTFRLTNINRSEPPADLFTIPGSYRVLDKR